MKHELFPTLVKEYNFTNHPDKKRLLEVISKTTTKSYGLLEGGVTNFDTGKDSNFLRINSFNKLIFHFEKCIEDYSKDIGIIPNKISNSWFNIMNQGNKTIRHHHYGGSISGAYYPLLKEGTCNLNFFSPISMYQSSWWRKNNVTEYNSDVKTISIKQDYLYLFPSWLEHETEINRGGKRIVISFNATPWIV